VSSAGVTVPPSGQRERQSVSSGVLESPVWQLAGLLLAILSIFANHWENDGLWFQGDAPRHAVTGFFYWDLLTALPRHPLSYALSYYARYPVINVGAYPPLFHLVEGFALAVVPSAYAVKALVTGCAAVAGLYTMLWGRRWIGPLAGWAGLCTVLTPGFVRYSTAILLNIPAVATGMAALYHLHAWLETDRARDRRLFVLLTVATILTYIPGGLVLLIAGVWALCFGRRAGARFLLLLAGLLAALIMATAIALPTHLARQLPTVAKLMSPVNWTFYGRVLTELVGEYWCVLASAGFVVGMSIRARRRETGYLATAFVAAIVALAFLPARDERYALLLAPLLILTAFLLIVVTCEILRVWRQAWAITAVAALAALSVRASVEAAVPVVSGIDQVADYLKVHGESDSVLYSGVYEGVFGFYLRAGDPGFRRRLVLSSKLLYRYEQDSRFVWVETPHVSLPEEAIEVLRARSGCRWIAVEIGRESELPASDRHLREALKTSAFERVESFPVRAGRVTRVDLYRIKVPLAPPPPTDLVFPSFSPRVFRGVEPIPSRF
jgi:hypothetical protein